MGTVAEAWLEQGRAEGKTAASTRLLEQRFGPLPREVKSRIVEADLDELGAWLDRVLDAATLDVVFGFRAAH